MSKTNLLIAILPLVGVAFGWGLTQVTNFLNIYLSDRRILKETLYFLLELYQQISTVKSIDDASESYLRTLDKSIPNFTSNEIEYKQALQVIRKMMTDFHNPRIETELQELNENYDNCLLKLASVDPISAYRLKGRNKIVSYLNQWNDYATETILSNPLVNADPKAIQFSEILKPQIEIRLIDESLTDLKEIIKTLVKKIGGKAKKDFDKLIVFSESETKIEIDERMKKYVNEVMIPAIKKMQDNENNI